jgi:hypothetical protein
LCCVGEGALQITVIHHPCAEMDITNKAASIVENN